MKYHDSSCTFEELRKYDSFVVDRHALRIIQPISMSQNGTYRIDCHDDEGRRYGRIDFSKGYSQWWHLSHIDFHLPSEHTQEGKRYDGELHMYHFYSVSGEQAGVDNEVIQVLVDTSNVCSCLLNIYLHIFTQYCRWHPSQCSLRPTTMPQTLMF